MLMAGGGGGGGGNSYMYCIVLYCIHIMDDMDVCQAISNLYPSQTKLLTKFWTLCRQSGKNFRKYIP